MDTLIKQAARPVIEELMKKARLSLGAYDVEEGISVLSQVNAMIKKYGIEKDSLLQKDIHDLGEQLENMKCAAAKRNFDGLIEKSSEYEKEEKYISALMATQKAIKVSQDHSACGISDTAAWLMKVRLDVLADYQRLKDDAESWIGTDDQTFIRKYAEAGKYFKQNNLKQYGAKFLSLHDFVISQQDTGLTRYMFRLYMENQEPEKALDMMKLLADMGSNTPADERFQKQLAIRLALRDQRQDQGKRPEELLNEYSSKNKYYRNFRKSYKMTWINGQSFQIRYLYLILK